MSRQHGEPQAEPKGKGFRPPPAFVLAVGVALVVGGVAIARSGAFNIRHVEVEGAQVVNARVIAEVSGLEGRPIVGTDLGRAERRIEEMPMVADVEISRVWPLGVRIRVTEMRGLVLWERGGVRYVVGKDGDVLEGVDAPPDVPVVVDLRDGVPGAGEALAPRSVAQAASDLASLMPSVVGRVPDSFRYELTRGLVVTTGDGLTAVFGDGTDLDYKLAVWKALLAAPDQKLLTKASVQAVDLRYGDRPAIGAAIVATATPQPERPRATPTATPRSSATARATASPAAANYGLAAGDAARRPGTGGR